MRSPTAALLWDIWCRKQRSVWAVAGLTAISWLAGADHTLNEVLGMLSFLLLFGIFNYTEFSGDTGQRHFPCRLFTLPVSSLRLVAVPIVAGIASVALLYVVWMERLSRGGPTSPLFAGTLLAALIVFYQAVLWTLARLGPLRLVVLGTIGTLLFGIGLLPSFPPSPPPTWRSETALAGIIIGLAAVVFLLSWRHVARLRSGGRRGGHLLAPLIARMADAWPRRRREFASPGAAHFWFEWRCSGMALPVLVGGVLLMVIAPLSWVARHAPDDTMQLLLVTLATPIALAIAVGMAFSRPTIWSDDLSVPAFVAVRPLSADEIVATKMKVAAASVAISWLVVLLFLSIWLSSWAHLDALSRLAIQLWAIHHRSVSAVSGIAALIVIAGMFLTWRFLVNRLWTGLSGDRRLFIASAAPIVLVVMAWAVLDAGRLPGWILEVPSRLTPVVWIAAVALVAKSWLAAYAWRDTPAQHVWRYLLVWLGGTTCFVALALVLWEIARMYLPLDAYRFQSLLVLLALTAVPIGRIGLAPSFLARNRHR